MLLPTVGLIACGNNTSDEEIYSEMVSSQDSAASENGTPSVEPLLFPAADVSETAIETKRFWFDVADRAWFVPDSYGCDRFNPVYLAMTGDDMQATVNME